MLSQKLPECTLDVYDPKSQNSRKVTVPKDLGQKFTLILYYPADFSLVCPTELEDLKKRKADFEKIGLEIIVASTDTAYTHKAWIETDDRLKGFDYLMVGDHNGAFAKALGIYNEANGLARRSSFIVDPDGVICVEYGVVNNIGRSSGEILRLARSLKYVRENPGTSCPANWDEGHEALGSGPKK